jgi:hypothetical protein
LSYSPNLQLPWSQITEHIDKKYQVVDTISLDAYSYQTNLLYERLLPYKSKNFASNEKIICYLFDTEFVLNNIGFSVYNFQLILSDLDISQSAILFLTSHYGIEKEIHRLGRELCSDSWPMQVISSSYVQVLSNPAPTRLETSHVDKIQYPYVCLNGVQRSHRIMLLCCLEDQGIINHGLTTWNFYNNQKTKTPPLPPKPKNNNCVFLTTNPLVRINDNIAWDQNLQQIYSKHHTKFYNQTGSTYLDNTYNYEANCQVEDHFLQSFLYVITETVFEYPYCFLTEKTFKAILNRRPFVVLGPTGILKQLKKLGFKTFDQVIDESYDTMVDHSKRLLKIADIVSWAANLSSSEIKQIMSDIESILEFNHNHYCQNYCQTDLENVLSML